MLAVSARLSSMICSDLVSVIIPTYNRDRLLIEALESVKFQTYRPIEVIVVDDGSTDDTQEVVKWFSEANLSKNFQIIYLYQKNKGPSAARNTGLVAASSEYVQFLDSDDLIHPNKIEIHVNALRNHSDIHCIFSDRKNFDASPKWAKLSFIDTKKVKSESYYLSFNFLSNAGLYRKNSCFLAGLWNECLWLGEDLEFNLRVLGLNEWILYLDCCLSACRQHSGSRLTTSTELSDLRFGNLILCDELARSAHNKIRSDNPKIFDSIAVLYSRLALDFMLHGDRTGALKTIHNSRHMPLSQQRLQRLTILMILAHMPSPLLRIMWKIGEYYRAAMSSRLTNRCF